MSQVLQREIGVGGALLMGLGSIIGTGVFVSIGLAAGSAGPAMVLAMTLAAGVALCNGLSSAQLAARHPVSGGTYEYGYRWLNPTLGFLAGWMFLCAKSASAATAALGCAGYFWHALGQPASPWRVPLALTTVVVLTGIVLLGMRKSNRANAVIVSATLLSLVTFILVGLPTALANGMTHLTPFFGPAVDHPVSGLLEACALLFVAYTGYGRIATLGEEIRDPARNIPRTILLTLLVTLVLYVAVGLVGIAAVGAEAFGTVPAAPLEAVARQVGGPMAGLMLAVGAVTAMLSVLLNLLLGLSRVVLALGRRGDLPAVFGRLDRTGQTPTAAVLLVGAAIAGLVLLGDVKTTWSFSAFTVLVYYALTNLCALRMSAAERLYPPVVAWLGLASCLLLAFWVDPHVWLVGVGLLVAGLPWHWWAQRHKRLTPARTA